MATKWEGEKILEHSWYQFSKGLKVSNFQAKCSIGISDLAFGYLMAMSTVDVFCNLDLHEKIYFMQYRSFNLEGESIRYHQTILCSEGRF